MNEVLIYLDERKLEYERHLSIAHMLFDGVDEAPGDGELLVEIRHINTLKSGLLIHLYNIVEAVMTRTLANIGTEAATELPKKWKKELLSEWVRAEIWSGEDRIGPKAIERMTDIGSMLASGDRPPAFTLKGEPGSWTDKAIKRIAKRLGCKLNLPRSVSRSAYERKYRNEQTAMQFLANRRNAIAHGESTFEDGANDLTLDDLEELASRILPYLDAICKAFKQYIDQKQYLVEQGATA